MNNGKRANQSDIRGVLAHLGQTRQTAKRKISPVGGHFWRQWGRVERWNFFKHARIGLPSIGVMGVGSPFIIETNGTLFAQDF